MKRAKLIVVDDILDDYSLDKIHQILEILNLFKKEGISILWINNYPDSITEAADKDSCHSKREKMEYCFIRRTTKKKKSKEV